MALLAPQIDDLVREYLLFRGFTQTLKTLDLEIKLEKEKGFNVDRYGKCFTKVLLVHIQSSNPFSPSIQDIRANVAARLQPRPVVAPRTVAAFEQPNLLPPRVFRPSWRRGQAGGRPAQAVRGQLPAEQEGRQGKGVLRQAERRAAGTVRVEGLVRLALHPGAGEQPDFRPLLLPTVAGHARPLAPQLFVHGLCLPAASQTGRLLLIRAED